MNASIGRIVARLGVACVAAIMLTAAPAGSDAARKLAPPRVTVMSLTALPGASAQRFRVSLVIDNQNTEPLPITELRFTLRLGGEGIMTAESAAPVTIAALDRKTLEFDLDADLVSSLSRLLALVQGPNSTLRYELFGNMTLDRRGQKRLPIAVSGSVPLSMPAER